MPYPAANLGLDEDIVATGAAMKQAEGEYNRDFSATAIPQEAYEPEFRLVQTDADSDPICASSGWCGPHSDGPDKKKPVIYTIGPLDPDIIDTKRHLKQQEKKHGTWQLPPDVAAVALSASREKQSDPACSSAGDCGSYKDGGIIYYPAHPHSQ